MNMLPFSEVMGMLSTVPPYRPPSKAPHLRHGLPFPFLPPYLPADAELPARTSFARAADATLER